MKKTKSMLKLFLFLLGVTAFSCSAPTASQNSSPHLYQRDDFKNYWYNGKAEINTYRLSQSRYGENSDGSAVLIFVSEDVSQKKQVKLDNPASAGSDKVSVLKMNFTKNFVTGVYPYSMMLSVFTPIERHIFPHTLKATFSSQEWCGQVFGQLNLKNKKYQVQSNSYFESEGDQADQLNAVWLEDELWNLIRLDPGQLPVGEVTIIPGFFFTRLLHSPMKEQKATITSKKRNDQVEYSIQMPLLNRTLVITYRLEFPHTIVGWEEHFIERGKPVSTKALLEKSIRLDYWNKNKNEFISLRDSLGLSRKNY
ncbi:MAG: hypothetical protein ORN54_07850 [Cyclobacteriaceae bacterium]|nr:hypothetical protein [Cyclobacteriaceae bacterium]